MVPNAYPTDLTSTFNLALAQATGTLSVTAMNGTTPIAGASITVTGGPSGVNLTGTTDANGVVNFPGIPAGSAPYTVTGTYGAATFQQTGVTVPSTARRTSRSACRPARSRRPSRAAASRCRGRP